MTEQDKPNSSQSSSSPPSDEKKEPCETCKISVGMAFTYDVCSTLKDKGKDVDCDKLMEDFKEGRMSVDEVIEVVKEYADEEEKLQLEEIMANVRSVKPNEREKDSSA